MDMNQAFAKNLAFCCKGVTPELLMVMCATDFRTWTYAVHDQQNRASVDVGFDASAENKVFMNGHPSLPILNVVRAALELTMLQLTKMKEYEFKKSNAHREAVFLEKNNPAGPESFGGSDYGKDACPVLD